MRRIGSPNNPILKTVRRLSRSRKREDHYLVEGRKLVAEALSAGVPVEAILYRTDVELTGALSPSELPEGAELVELEARAFEALASQVTPEGVLALVRRTPSPPLPQGGIVAVAAGVRDPGNLGAIARTVEAAGADALVVLPGTTDAFAPKALRGSMGSLFRVPVVALDDLSPLQRFRTVALVRDGGEDYRRFDWSAPVAVLLGDESLGLTPDRLARCDHRVSIPMRGEVESLNVGTAAALALYEAARQRDGASGPC